MAYNAVEVMITSNIITDGYIGVMFNNVSDSEVSYTNFTEQALGSINCTGSTNITIKANEFVDCGGIHVILIDTTDSLIYNNQFFTADNGDAFDDGTNDWDNDSCGNYWCNYTGLDTDGDGYGNTPYDITGGVSQDNFPWADVNIDIGITMYDILIAVMPLVLVIMIFGLLMKNVKKIFIMK
jgi:nitrous oxidase accessory protein NosD